MGDITVLAPSRLSKTSLSLDRSSIGSGIPIEAPAFTLPPRNIRVPLGGTARFDGKVRGYPEPRVTWHRNGQPVAEEDRFSMDRIIRGTFCLVIKGVQAGDDGKYTCEAANEGGVRQVTVELTVEGSGGKKYGLPSSTKTPGSRSMMSSADNKPGIWGESPPKFVTKPSKVIVKEGQMGRFSCKITGRPPPQVNWFKGDVQLQHGGRFNMVEKSGLHILEIQDVRLLDAGTYTCAVTNTSGKASLSTELVVQGSDVTDSFSLQPTTTLLKTPKSSEVQQITTNGIVKEQKTSSTDITFKGKEQPTSTKETQHVSLKEAPSTPTKDIPDNKQKQVKESRTEASRATKLETKKSNPPESSGSTITLQSIKIQPAQRTHSKMSSISASEERKTGAQEPPLQTRKTSSTPQARSRDFESRKVTVEHNRDVRGSPPAFDIQPVNQEATEGEDVIFRCKVSGKPKPSVEWFKDGAPVTRRECAQECDEDGVHSLCLQKTHVGDSGSYSCTVSNSRGSITSNWMLTVNSPKVEEIAPHFSSTLEGCVVTEGQSFTLQCTVEGVPEPEISWLLNDESIPDLQSTLEDGVATLTVQKALPEDDGVYTCVAENSAGKESCSATVTVQEKKIQKSVGRSRAVQPSKVSPPVFLKGLSDQKVMDGSQVIMTVEVSANPPPEVNWLHNGKEIQESEDFHFEKKGNEYSLYIQEVFPEDTGKYTCEVWNDEGEAVSEATLTVQEPQDGIQPWFISKPKSVTATAGENVLISCAIAGDPFPAVHWLKDGRELVEKEGIEILQNEDVFTLVMRNAQAQNAGRYEIQLKNPVGECSCQVSLTFRESSVSRGSPRREGREQTSPDESQDVADHGAVRFGRRGSAPRSFGDIRPAEQEQEDIRGLLKRRIEVRERTEDRLREQEAEQLDFRNVLGKKVSTKAVSEEALKEIPAEQMDFRANLQRQVKPKTLSEDERKVNTPQQVDFRAVLAKKGTPKPIEKVAPKPSNPDFRSLLSHKTKPLTENGNGTDAVGNTKTPPNENDSVNCEHGCEMVDGGVNEKKPQDKGVPPSFLEKLQDARIVDGEKLVLQCRIAADPPATVTWTLNGKTIKSSKFIVISQEGPLCSLVIEKAFPEDEGAYKCIAANGAGTAECACSVLVDDSKATQMKSKAPRSSLSPLPATQSKPL